MKRELPFEVVCTGYGLTEATAMVTVTAPDDPPEVVAGWSGKVCPGVWLRIVDPDGASVGDGQEGELLVRGFNIMRGYFGEPEATAAAVDADGWLHTGDIAVSNSDGYLKITGRKKDIYITGGFNVAPAEVENALLEFPGISDVAVIGVPDHRLGEVGAAFVMARPGDTVTPAEVIGWARERLANFKVPRYVLVTGELPLNASGKVLKHVLRQRFADLDPDTVTRAAC
jgi:acyl-CoA synthetase (AMP-forming)/AMP-acid ligase II